MKMELIRIIYRPLVSKEIYGLVTCRVHVAGFIINSWAVTLVRYPSSIFQRATHKQN